MEIVGEPNVDVGDAGGVGELSPIGGSTGVMVGVERNEAMS